MWVAVLFIRTKYSIDKPQSERLRECEKLPELAYGMQAQADFGEINMEKEPEGQIKVYFFVIVLSRSRYKYVHFEDQPFTSATAIYAHEKAFVWFEGIPKEILYDQDKVFISDENLGDYKLTHEFKAYCQSQPFKAVFCRKADPQSKGKVENVVKYIKYNFLRGRIYRNLSALNQSAQEWLKRTGNAKKHSSTHKIPAVEWQVEKMHLFPVLNNKFPAQIQAQEYNVRKDNTVAYKGNFYSLPTGTYQGRESRVLLEIQSEKILFYDAHKIIIASHQLSANKGELVRNTDHGRNKTTSIELLIKEVNELFANTPIAELYLEKLHGDKPRYIHDNLRVLRNIVLTKRKKNIDIESAIQQTIENCLENKIYNANAFAQILDKLIETKRQKSAPDLSNILDTSNILTVNKLITEIIPQKSEINTYENIINHGTN